MSGARYTPGHGEEAVALMSRRRAATHAPEALALLSPGMRVLDCGCGPGTITLDLAVAAAPGEVVGVDAAQGQLELASARAHGAGASNVRVVRAGVEDLPIEDGSVDLVHAHALMEHVGDPLTALREMARVLRPGGAMVLTSPDWNSFLVTPADEPAEAALASYRRRQEANGGDTRAGRRLAGWMTEAGLVEIVSSTRHERYDDARAVADYLAEGLEREGQAGGQALRAWAKRPGAGFANAWTTTVGRRPSFSPGSNLEA